jgi:hypothetical protein
VAYAHFLIPAEGGDAEKRLQEFLRTHVVLKVEQRFAERPEGRSCLASSWANLFRPVGPEMAELNRRSSRRFRDKWRAMREAWEEGTLTDAKFGEKSQALVACTERAACKNFRSPVYGNFKLPLCVRRISIPVEEFDGSECLGRCR